MPRDRNEGVSLYVSGFRDNTRPSDLASLFEPHGRIADVYIPKDYYSGLPRGFAYVQYADEEDARRVFESGEEFTLDGRRLGLEYAQGRRKSPHQMRGTGGRGGDRRRSRSPDRHYRPSSRRYSRSRSRSRDRRDRRRDSRSPVRRRSRSRSPSRRRSPSPRSYRRSPSPRRDRRSPSPRSPRRRSPSPEGRRRTPSRGDSPERSSSRRPHSASPERANNDSQHTNGAPEDGSWGEYAPDHNGAPGFEPMA
ncbi:hypothetical protein MVEG_11523 [Podila verticillata NRRL 6337]|uniref:RRM domain-containing protein n=1 Tax=Podila verticillata NRRL 6337 TaxID=1069443 RepID=A0A086TK35_9FUNG|nr:MAG: hypothetical protein BYD32DRAFT_414636 [Podila humilis]KFH62312.1 hypothetical protein MVEG_11523 [Podila verticillata NRRL 6337]